MGAGKFSSSTLKVKVPSRCADWEDRPCHPGRKINRVVAAPGSAPIRCVRSGPQLGFEPCTRQFRTLPRKRDSQPGILRLYAVRPQQRRPANAVSSVPLCIKNAASGALYLSALSTEDPRSLQRIRSSGGRGVSSNHNVTAVKVKLLTNSSVGCHSFNAEAS